MERSLPEAVIDGLTEESKTALYTGAKVAAEKAAGFAALRVMLDGNTLELYCLEHGEVQPSPDDDGDDDDETETQNFTVAR